MNWARSRNHSSAYVILMRIFMELKLMKMWLRDISVSLQTLKHFLFVFMLRTHCLHSHYSWLWHCDCVKRDSDGCILVVVCRRHMGAAWKPFKTSYQPICPSESLWVICERKTDGWRIERESLFLLTGKWEVLFLYSHTGRLQTYKHTTFSTISVSIYLVCYYLVTFDIWCLQTFGSW